MPEVSPFVAVQYRRGVGDVSALVAPPYDVLDPAAKRALLARDQRNIVAIDLPHIPAKELGPPEIYARAADTYRSWLVDGTLAHRPKPAMFAYRQTFRFGGSQRARYGMACTVQTLPFGPRQGGGILPHEQTFSGPKEDRLALMKSTAAQLSPIFGLHPDEQGRASTLLRTLTASRPPDMTANLGDGVLHEVWTVEDSASIRAYRDALAGEDIFVADGHHRYNTALNYLASRGDLPDNHPARRIMMVLVGMADPGLVIGATHRVLGGMSGYTLDALKAAAEPMLHLEAIEGGAAGIERAVAARADRHAVVLGLVDMASGAAFVAWPRDADPLARSFAAKPRAWRLLDVAIIQHLIVERICEPRLNDGKPVKWAFPHSIDEVLEIGRGQETGAGGGAGFAQLAVIVRPTPLEAVREISRAGELMPQKSTFFYPKLATGLFIHPLEPLAARNR